MTRWREGCATQTCVALEQRACEKDCAQCDCGGKTMKRGTGEKARTWTARHSVPTPQFQASTWGKGDKHTTRANSLAWWIAVSESPRCEFPGGPKVRCGVNAVAGSIRGREYGHGKAVKDSGSVARRVGALEARLAQMAEIHSDRP